jgi:formate--tetrahydrofolate ligase
MTDLDIARSVTPKPIEEIAAQINVAAGDLEKYGHDKAKLPLHLIDESKVAKNKLILVTGISPTPAGEGKTTVSIGLAQALSKTGNTCTAVLREPSLGPVFGIKGGAAGGGYSQVIPMESINLHFTGDFAAIEKAHNLLSALIDNNLQNKKFGLGLDPRTVTWKRVMDMNDRALRDIVIGLGGMGQGIPRETGFDITAASEIMAILCLSKDLMDLKERCSRIFIGFTTSGQAIYAKDLKAHGAMAALMKEAIKPNLVQTLEGTPAIIHGGPFANIAQGTNSVIATKMGLSLSDYVVTEAGFGCDLGAEKFLDIKCASSGLSPKAVVLVATIRALKYHGGMPLSELKTPDVKALQNGFPNLEKHIENIKQFGLPPVVAINSFTSDSAEELQCLADHCKELGVKVAISDVWGKGGAGAEQLAAEVIDAASHEGSAFTPMYKWEWSITDKIEAVATKIYGADHVDYTARAKADLRRIDKFGLNGLAVCIAKTQKSLSDDPALLGRPKGFTITVREIQIAAGAGFVVPITGEIMRMPGLPGVPSAEAIDIDAEGNISGLF